MLAILLLFFRTPAAGNTAMLDITLHDGSTVVDVLQNTPHAGHILTVVLIHKLRNLWLLFYSMFARQWLLFNRAPSGCCLVIVVLLHMRVMSLLFVL